MSKEKPIKFKPQPVTGVGILVGLVLIGFVLARQTQPKGEKLSVSGVPGGKCQNIDTSDWLSHDSGITVKYPLDWHHREEKTEGKVEASGWFFSYGLRGVNPVVWSGFAAKTLNDYYHDLTSVYKAGVIEKSRVGGQESFKFTIQDPEVSYLEEIHWTGYSFNVPRTFRGPALSASSHFDNCEAEIFQLMLGLVDLGTVLPDSGGSSDSGPPDLPDGGQPTEAIDEEKEWG